MRPDDASPLSIRLFGPFAVRLNGRPPPRLTFRKSQSVLALLALRHGCEVERDWLAALLWPEAAPSAALNSLRKCLTDLRHALGAEAGRLRSPMPRTLCLDLTGAFADALAYDAAMARGDPCSLAEAVALYRGRLLEGWAEEWVFEERQPREQRYLAALEKLAALALQRGETAEMERVLRLAVAADPLRESAQRSLMQVLANGGSYAAALLAYRELRQRLHRELNTEPDPETKALFERLRGQAREKADRPTGRRGDGGTGRIGGGARARPVDQAVRGESCSSLRPVALPFRPHVPAPAGENRLVTVLFAAVSRSVETMPDPDPEEAAACLGRLLGVMAEAVLQFGGQVDRFLGDGVLAIFGAPQAHEDDAERAIRAALGIRDAAARLGYRVTAGINSGIVYAGAVGTERHRETMVVGPVVNLAARLREQAGSGQILLGSATYHLTRRAFEFSPQSLAADGTAEAVVAYSVTRALARPEKARGIEGLRTPLIGREEELAKLQGALAGLLRGRGQIVSLIGEAGVGKSRLIAELRQGVQAFRRSGVQAFGTDKDNPLARNVGRERLNAECPNARTPDRLAWLEGRCLELAVTDRYSLFVDLLRHYFAWPAEEGEAARVARIAAALSEGAARGALSTARAEEIGPLLADLFSLRWGQQRDDADRQGVGSDRSGPTPHTLHPTPSDPEQRRQQTLLAIRDFLLALARQQPLILVLEDLHWADSLSLDLISLLMEPLAQEPLFLLCSYRPEPESTRSAGTRCSRLGTIAAQKCAGCFTELRLRELTPLQSQKLVAALLGTPELPPPVKELVLDRSRGNPFFMEELVHSLLDQGVLYREGAGTHGGGAGTREAGGRSAGAASGASAGGAATQGGGHAQRGSGAWHVREEPVRRVPESVQGMILSRVDRLDPELKQVLQIAAVIGRVFHRRLLEEVVASGEWGGTHEAGRGSEGHRRRSSLPELTTHHCPLSTALWALEERELIYQERVIPEEEYSFRHVLVQETVYTGILRSQRAGLHLQVARAIERLQSERLDAHCEPLAFHYERSGTEEEVQARALDYLVRAAERAHRTAAHREEAALLTRAIGMAERLGERDRITDLRARRGGALARVGVYPEARADLEAALEGLAADRLEPRAEVLADLCTVCFWGLDAPGLRRYAPQALSLAEVAGREDLAASAMAWLAETVKIEGRLISARDLYRRATVRAGGVRVAPLANFPAALYMLGQIPEAVETGRKALEAARGANDTLFTMYALSHLGLALGASGRYGEAIQIFAEARQFGQEYDVGPLLARAISMSAGLHLDVFDFIGNEALAEEVRDRPRSGAFPPSVVSAGIDLLLNFARRQEVSRAERLVDEVSRAAQDEKLAERHGWQWKMRLPQARAEIALARADWSDAAHWADEAIAQSRATGRVKYQVLGLGARGKALAGLGRKREGIAALQEAVLLARPVGDPAMFLRAATALLELEGDGDLAAEARAAAKRIAAALPDEAMRRRFAAAEPVRLLGRLD